MNFTTDKSTHGAMDCPHPILSETRDMFVRVYGSLSAASEACGYKPRVLSNQLMMSERHKLGFVDVYSASIAGADTGVIQSWANDLGLTLFRLPDVGCVGDVSLMCSFSDVIKEFGDVCNHFHATMTTNTVRTPQVERMYQEALEVIEALFVMLKKLESLQQ